jgi:NADPH-dependent glutamate synthase beta subunit-like oxidoreductase
VSASARFKTMEKGFGLVQALAEADRCLLCHDAPCSKGCPAETDPGTFIRKLRLRNITGAIRTVRTNNALGGACGVLCPTARLCERECSATGILRPIEIGKIQRFLVEHSWKTGFDPVERKPVRPETVAVVGSGPAGLSCAAELAREGFPVTVFEQRDEPGGVIRYGVPGYRFDREFLRSELAGIERLGVRFKCRTRIDGAEGVQKLFADGFSAVFLGPGLWEAERLSEATRPKGVHTSVDFLAGLRGRGFTALEKDVAGKVVAVIGGGSVAMDCAESALKLGARDVYLVYRRSFAQMPAEEDERAAALRLGVHFLLLNQPLKYIADGRGRLAGLRLTRTSLGAPDASGRRRPEAVKGSGWTLPAAVAVEAIGNRPDSADWSAVAKVDGEGRVVANAKTRRASPSAVFAGGDIVRGPALVVEAVQDGKLAARAIRAALDAARWPARRKGGRA